MEDEKRDRDKSDFMAEVSRLKLDAGPVEVEVVLQVVLKLMAEMLFKAGKHNSMSITTHESGALVYIEPGCDWVTVGLNVRDIAIEMSKVERP